MAERVLKSNMDIVNNYANKEKVSVSKVYADSSDGPKCYGVETTIKGKYTRDGKDSTSTEWFETQEQQHDEYIKVIGEVSRGEWV